MKRVFCLLLSIFVMATLFTACTRRQPVTPEEESQPPETVAIPEPETPAAESAVESPVSQEPESSGIALDSYEAASAGDGTEAVQVTIRFRNNTADRVAKIYFDYEAYTGDGELVGFSADTTGLSDQVIAPGETGAVQVLLDDAVSALRLTVTKYETEDAELRDIPAEEAQPLTLDITNTTAGSES